MNIVQESEPYEFMNSFAQKLRETRVAKGFSQNELANRAGVDSSYINRIEREERDPPTRRVVVALSEALGLDPQQTDELLLGAGCAPTTNASELLHQQIRQIPLLQLLAEVLTDDTIPDEEVELLKKQVQLLRRRYRPDRSVENDE